MQQPDLLLHFVSFSGDKVIPLFLPYCRKCPRCRSSTTNLCKTNWWFHRHMVACRRSHVLCCIHGLFSLIIMWLLGKTHSLACWLMAPAGSPAKGSRSISSSGSAPSVSTRWFLTRLLQKSDLMLRWIKSVCWAVACPRATALLLTQARWDFGSNLWTLFFYSTDVNLVVDLCWEFTVMTKWIMKQYV